MTQPAYLPQTARQNVDYQLEFSVRQSASGQPWPIGDWIFTMQVRREPGDPGEPLIEVTNASTSGGNGILVTVTDDLASVVCTIEWETLNADTIPAGRLAYDLVADLPSGERWGFLYGEFIAKQGVTVP